MGDVSSENIPDGLSTTLFYMLNLISTKLQLAHDRLQNSYLQGLGLS